VTQGRIIRRRWLLAGCRTAPLQTRFEPGGHLETLRKTGCGWRLSARSGTLAEGPQRAPTLRPGGVPPARHSNSIDSPGSARDNAHWQRPRNPGSIECELCDRRNHYGLIAASGRELDRKVTSTYTRDCARHRQHVTYPGLLPEPNGEPTER
jgi:hypothetical protein